MRTIFLQNRLYIFLASSMLSGEDLKQPGISAVGDQQRLRNLVADLKNTLAPSPLDLDRYVPPRS